MISPIGMETFEARLESFNAAHAITKKRTSNTKGAGKLKWPHKSPAPAQLARAGFFYNPTSSTPDNTTCYLCHSSLDGWEEDDSAVGEHINFSPDCGWAVVAHIEQDIEDGHLEQQDPMDERLLHARSMTFGARWPHEDKRGWLCKTQKMTEAGWYYCPTAESDDFVRCCYCNLSLDGWEPKDNPYDEHQRRSPDCIFFARSRPNSRKTGRGKRGRASRISRMSTQSNITTTSDDISMIDVDMNENNSRIRRQFELMEPSKPTNGAKKGVKGKKAAPRSKRKASAAQQVEAVGGSSFVEPEDDNFEVKVEQNSQQRASGKKRKSDEMSIDNDAAQLELQPSQPPPQLPLTKRRATRSSVTHTNGVGDPISAIDQGDESYMTNTENTAPQPLPISKKATRGGKKRASSSTRKASTTSTASKASLRATIPNDEDIDAALEADLDKPLTEDEAEPDPPTMPKTRTRRLTRTRPGSRSVTASTAPVRRATRASALPVERDSMASVGALADDAKNANFEGPNAVEIALTAIDHAKQEIISETDRHVVSKAKSHNRPPSKPAKAIKKCTETVHDGHSPNESQAIQQGYLATKDTSREPANRQTSDQPQERKIRTSEISAGSVIGDNISELNSSVLAPTVVHEESANEAHGGRANQTRAKKVGRPRSTAAKKGRAVKKGAATSRMIEEVDHVEKVDATRSSLVALVDIKVPDRQGSGEELTLPEAPKGDNQATDEGDKQIAMSKEGSELPPSRALATEPAEPVEARWVTAHENKATIGIATPADSQDQGEGRKTPVRSPSPRVQVSSAHETPKMVASPQSSDAENQPPSSRPSALRPPLLPQTPSKTQAARVPLAATTPTVSPLKRNISRLQTTLPWESIEFEKIFKSPSADKENIPEYTVDGFKQGLSSPEKKLTVEEWIRWNAKRGEEKLRADCERLMGRFEGEGVRALKTLEGIVCTE